MNSRISVSLLLLTLVVSSGLYFLYSTPTPPSETTSGAENLTAPDQIEPVDVIESSVVDAITAEPHNETFNDTEVTKNPPVDVMAIGLSPLSDDEFLRLQAQLLGEDDLLARLLEELRNNTNPQRSKQLIALLGEHNKPGVLQTASEMIYSGDPESQKLGLDLLSRIQPKNAQAREMAIELLTSETDPTLLVATMNVLATPATSATQGQRDALLDNTSVLANHENANVRSHSIELIGRWNQSRGVDTLTRGINDPHPQVRARAVSALRGIDNPSDQIINDLLNIAENTAEAKTTRQSALYSLRSMPLTDLHQQRFDSAQTSVRTRQLNTQ